MAQINYIGNTRISPLWAVDFGGRDHIMPFPGKIDISSFNDQLGPVVQVAGAATIGATSITIQPLAFSALANTILIAQGDTIIKAGTVLAFSATQFAQLTADAVYGATTLSVSPLQTALVGTESAEFSKYGVKFIPSGTAVGRYNPNRTSTGLWEPAVANMDEIYLTYFDVPDANIWPDIEFYRPPSVVRENFLPQYPQMIADVGIAAPIVAPTLAVAGSTGSVGSGIYSVGYSYLNANGETSLSPVSSISKPTTEYITVSSIAFPTGVTGIRFYVSASPGSSQLRYAGEIDTAGATNILTDGTGVLAPTVNTTVGAWGSLLTAIRSIYKTIQGVQ